MKSFIVIFSLVTCLFLLCNCSTRNRNIVTTIHSGMGIAVTYNPQTQFPEVKLGWIRSSFFLVPTSLNNEPDGFGGSAAETPIMVAHQKIHVGFFDGISVDDKFVLGDISYETLKAAKSIFNNNEIINNNSSIEE